MFGHSFLAFNMGREDDRLSPDDMVLKHGPGFCDIDTPAMLHILATPMFCTYALFASFAVICKSELEFWYEYP